MGTTGFAFFGRKKTQCSQKEISDFSQLEPQILLISPIFQRHFANDRSCKK
jgi:hypothetical protein